MKKYLSTILDNINVLVYVADIKTHEILYINEYTKEILGDITGKICWQTIQHGQDGPCNFCTNDKIVTAEGKPTGVYHWEFKNTVTDKWFDILDRAIEWNDGRIVRLEVATDITRLKKIEESLQKSQNFLLESQEIAEVGSYVLDLPAGIWQSSKVLDSIFGIDKNFIRSIEAWATIIHPEDKQQMVDYFAHEVLEKKGTFNKEYRIIRINDGNERWVHGRGELEFDKNNIPIKMIGTIQDITDRKKAELERERLNNELQTKNKELEQVLYVASHDLRSPLVNVEGFSKELDYSLQELMSALDNKNIPVNIKEKITSIVNEDIPESLHYIRTSILKMSNLLQGILDLSRLGRIEWRVEELDMNQLMINVVSNHEFRLEELNVKVDISELPKCMGDNEQINQIFSNLLDNAIKYLDPKRSGVIKVSGYNKGNKSIYCVEDNGIGVSSEHQDKIFEIFYQLAPKEIKGEGMGLAIVKKILERLNGKIWIESECGKGSKFFISLPKA